MASNRHLGRIIVLQSLYEFEIRERAGDSTAKIDHIIAKNILPYEKALGDVEFVYGLAHGVSEHLEDLDGELKPMAPEWPISTIAPIDRNILRMGLYELQYCHEQVPPKVAINEAVELAKAFGTENSSRFINGVLGTAFRQLGLTDDGGAQNAESDDKKSDEKNAENSGAQNVEDNDKKTAEDNKKESHEQQSNSSSGEKVATSASDDSGSDNQKASAADSTSEKNSAGENA